MGSSLRERFDRRAARYGNALTTWLGERELRVLRRLLPAGSNVLDYGCGGGRTSLDLLARGCRVTGYDISANMLGLARSSAERQGWEAEWVADEQALAGRRWSFVALAGVLDYYPDPRPLLRRVSRYLTPEGQLVATMPNAASPLAWGYWLASRFTVPCTPHTAGFVEQTLADCGLRLQQLRSAAPAWGVVGHTLVFSAARA